MKAHSPPSLSVARPTQRVPGGHGLVSVRGPRAAWENFGVIVGGSEYRIYLHHHLDPSSIAGKF